MRYCLSGSSPLANHLLLIGGISKWCDLEVPLAGTWANHKQKQQFDAEANDIFYVEISSTNDRNKA